MKQRPKLNLTRDKAVHKKQPTGFGARQAEGLESGQNSAENQSGVSAREDPGLNSRLGVTGATDWADSKRLLKVALVVAAAGLTIYLLKRRFF